MKKFISLLMMVTIWLGLDAQKTGTISNLTDAWGVSYSYSGEILNGKPQGMGVAKYSNGTVTRYVGQFENGLYSGKGVMFFENGAFSSGTWSKGKMNGKCGYTAGSGAFFAGEIANGMRNGSGIVVYKDNSFVKGNFKDDKLVGRCINLWTDGNIISDINYDNDKRNGTGFQYEVGANKLYEGEWKDDNWSQAASAGFYTFLNQSNFKGEKTADHILVGAVTSAGYLRDTAYFYDLKKHKRYFGYYLNGFIKDGVQIVDDSSRFIGATDDIGAKGYCYDFKINEYFTQGTFINDKINGDVIDIDLKKKTVYIGAGLDGAFTGKAYFFNDKGNMYYGDYIQGRLNGNGFRLESNGHYTEGTWKDGEPVTVTSIITPQGEAINASPKTFGESLNVIVKDYANYFDNIIGFASDEFSYDDWLPVSEDKDAYYEYYNTLTSFFGSTRPNAIADDLDLTNLYIVTLLQGADATKAKAKYNEVVKQLNAATVNNKILATTTKLKANASTLDMSQDVNATKFELDTQVAAYSNFHIWVKLRKEKDGKYAVSLELGDQAEL